MSGDLKKYIQTLEEWIQNPPDVDNPPTANTIKLEWDNPNYKYQIICEIFEGGHVNFCLKQDRRMISDTFTNTSSELLPNIVYFIFQTYYTEYKTKG